MKILCQFFPSVKLLSVVSLSQSYGGIREEVPKEMGWRVFPSYQTTIEVLKERVGEAIGKDPPESMASPKSEDAHLSRGGPVVVDKPLRRSFRRER